MAKKKILFVLLALIIVLTGYFAFKWFRGSAATWKLIPSDAMVVITSEHLQDSTYTATEAGLDIKRLPLIDIASDNLSLLNFLSKDKKRLHKFLSKKSITYSFHPKTGTEWGIVLYIPVKDKEEADWLARPTHPEVRVTHHSFQDNRITDLSDNGLHRLCSFIIKDNYLIVSYYGNLIEDVIRASSLNIEKFPLRSLFSKIDDTPFGTSVYLKAGAWKSVIAEGVGSSHYTEFLKNFPEFQDYHFGDINQKSSLTITSEGTPASKQYIAQWLKDGSGSSFNGHKYISQQTSLLYRYAAGDSASFQENFLKWHSETKLEAWDKVSYHIGQESQMLITNFRSELIMCQLEENNSINDGKILLAEYSNYEKLRPVLKKLAALSNDQSNSSTDKFQGYDIFSISVPEFPSGIFGPSFKGFSKSYVTYIAPYLVVSNNSQVLQNYIVDFENQISWKQSPEFDSILVSASARPQISLVANVRKLQSRNTQSFGKSYSDLNSKIESVVVQCRYEGKEAFPEITFNTKSRPSSPKVVNRTFLNLDIELPDMFDREMVALQNPVDGSSELLLSNQQYDLLKTTDLRTGKVENVAKLNGNLATGAFKVDFLNIGRQQRVFATPHTVYAIDQDDSTNYTTFSKNLPSLAQIVGLYLVDGGKDGSNRFVIKSDNEELYLWESVTQPLRRLSRNAFDGIVGPVVTLNQMGNRGFIVTQRNGKIFLLGENGSVRAGFPCDILTRADSPFTWTQDPETGQPELVGVSVSGELIHINLSGKVVSRQQLIRPEPGATFRLLFDKNSQDWILVRATRSKMAIITKDGRELFEIKDILPNATVEYNFFGVDNRFITIKSGSYSTIFDMSGKRLGDKAIPSEMPVKLTYQPGYYKLLIFSRSEKKIQVWSIKLR